MFLYGGGVLPSSECGVFDVASGPGPLPRHRYRYRRSSAAGPDTSVEAARSPVGVCGDSAVRAGVGCPVRWSAGVDVVVAVSGVLCHRWVGTRAGGAAGIAG